MTELMYLKLHVKTIKYKYEKSQLCVWNVSGDGTYLNARIYNLLDLMQCGASYRGGVTTGVKALSSPEIKRLHLHVKHGTSHRSNKNLRSFIYRMTLYSILVVRKGFLNESQDPPCLMF